MSLVDQRKIAIAVYIFYLTIYYVMLLLDIEPGRSYSNAFGLIGNAMCLPLFWIGVRLHDEYQRLPWKLLALGACAYLIGEGIWAYSEDWLGIEIDGPSVCDVYYIFNSIVCLCALFVYLQQFESISLMSASFDMAISVLSIGGIMFNFIVRPLLSDGFDGMLMAMYFLYSPLFDIALVSGLLLLLFGTEHHEFLTPTNLILGCGFSMMFVLDELFLVEEIYGIPFDEIINPLWSLPFFIISIASMYSPDEPVIELTSRFDRPLEYLRILLPYFLTLSIVVAIGVEYQLFEPLFVWGALMVLLLSVRQISVLISNKQLMETVRRNEEILNAQNAELHKLNLKITHDSEVDFLTQLSNRRHIDQTFERLMPIGDRQEALGLILIDVDFFKKVNDTFGHQIGDKILQNVSALIRAAARHNDIAGRFGGDEFILLLPGANKIVVSNISNRLLELARSDGSMRKYEVSLSIGGSSMMFKRDDYDIDQLLKRADEALYQAKEYGRDRFIVY